MFTFFLIAVFLTLGIIIGSGMVNVENLSKMTKLGSLIPTEIDMPSTDNIGLKIGDTVLIEKGGSP